MAGVATDLTVFNKAGTVVTNAAGEANVVFRIAQPFGFQYVVILTCAQKLVTAYPSNISQTGFTISTWNTTPAGGGALVAGVTVYWLVRSAYNE